MRRDSQEQFTKKTGGHAPVKECQNGCLISMMERVSRRDVKNKGGDKKALLFSNRT